MANKPVEIKGGFPDGALAEAVSVDTNTTYSDDDSKILVIKNNGSEVAHFKKDGSLSNAAVVTVLPGEGGAGIQAAINTVHATGGGIVQLLEGTYNVTSNIIPTLGASNIDIRGMGDSTVLKVFGASVSCFNFQPLNGGNWPLNNPTAADTSIYTTTASHAGSTLEGEWVILFGTDSSGNPVREWNFAAADGNPATGEIQLVNPVVTTMTSVTLYSGTGNINNSFSNMKILADTATYPSAITNVNPIRHRYENINFVGNFEHGLRLVSPGFSNVISRCLMNDVDKNPIQLVSQFQVIIEKCWIRDCAALNLENSHDVDVEKCFIIDSRGSGIDATGLNRRSKIRGCSIVNPAGILIEAGDLECTIADCHFVDGTNISCSAGKHIDIVGNMFLRCTSMVSGQTAEYITAVGNTGKEISGSAFVGGTNYFVVKGNNVDLGGDAYEGSCDYLIFEGNTIQGGFRGVRLLGDYAMVQGNTFIGNTQDVTVVSGVGHYIGPNQFGTTRNFVNQGQVDVAQVTTKRVTKAFDETDFAAAALTNDIEIFSLPAKASLVDIYAEVTQRFLGGSISSYTISVGISGSLTKYMLANDCYTATTMHEDSTKKGTALTTTGNSNVESSSAATSIRAQATSVGDNLDQATGGTIKFYITYRDIV